MPRTKRQKYFDPESILNGVEEALIIEVGDRLNEHSEFREGDMLLIDRPRSPRKGDLVVWDDGYGYRISRHEDMDFRTLEYTEIIGVLVTVIRDFRKRPKKSPAKQIKQAQNSEI